MKERLATASQALSTLADVLREVKTDIVRDAALQRFEYTFEAVWKAVQQYLRTAESMDPGSPKAAIRLSFRVGLLTEEQARGALEMADDRNLTVHTYNERLAEAIYARLAGYALLMSAWLDAMRMQIEQK